MTANATSDRNLIIVYGENWSQKDCIANKDIMLAIFAKDYTYVDSLEDKSLWTSQLRRFDKKHQYQLSKMSTEGARDKWSRIELANLKGVIGYFGDKLCKSVGSPNNDMRMLKTAYFTMMQDSVKAKNAQNAIANDLARPANAPGASGTHPVSTIRYPSVSQDSSDDEEVADKEQISEPRTTPPGQTTLDKHLLSVPFPASLSAKSEEVPVTRSYSDPEDARDYSEIETVMVTSSEDEEPATKQRKPKESTERLLLRFRPMCLHRCRVRCGWVTYKLQKGLFTIYPCYAPLEFTRNIIRSLQEFQQGSLNRIRESQQITSD